MRLTTHIALAAILLIALLAGCDSEDDTQCGAVACGANESCDKTSDPPVCRCDEGYGGENCNLCAVGYRATGDGACEPVPVSCSDPNVCGLHGTCVTERDGYQHCTCEDQWTGRFCAECASGYQDNAGLGVCREGCALVDLACEAPRVCRDESGTPRCDCPRGFTGPSCNQCAAGFRADVETAKCVETCQVADLLCPDHMTCSDADGAAACACKPGYQGDSCTTCAEGYTDALRPGSCLPTCAVLDDCGPHGSCVDTSEFGYCQCDGAWAGERCESCAAGHQGDQCELCDNGWVRSGDDACQPGCSALSVVLDCGTRGQCTDESGAAQCRCEPGYQGDGCASCVEGFTADGEGYCIGAGPTTHSLLGLGVIDGTVSLLAIDPATGALQALRRASLDSAVGDRSGPSIYTLTDGGRSLGEVNMRDGSVTTLASAVFDQTFGRALAFDKANRVIYSVSGTVLVSYDLDTGTATPIGDMGSVWPETMTWDAASNRLVLISSFGTPTLFEVDPTTAMPTEMGPVPAEIASTTKGMAIDSAGIRIVTVQQLTEEERLAKGCRVIAADLGLTGYEQAPASAQWTSAGIGPELSLTLESTQSAGAELVAYGSNGQRDVATAELRIATTNPDAVVCIGTDQEALDIRLDPSARFKAVIIMGREAVMRVVPESGFAAGGNPTVYVFQSRNPDPVLLAYPDVVRLYSPEEWQDRRLPTSLFEAAGTYQSLLTTVDRQTLMVTQTQSVAVELSPTLSVW